MVREVDRSVHYFVPSQISVRIAYPVLSCEKANRYQKGEEIRSHDHASIRLSSGQLYIRLEISHHRTSRYLGRRKEDEIEHQNVEWSVMLIIMSV